MSAVEDSRDRAAPDDGYDYAAAELADRRQRAREAALDGIADPTNYSMTVSKAVDAAIETATRVRVTPEIIEAAQGEWPQMTPAGWLGTAIEAAFRAAGFEVEQ